MKILKYTNTQMLKYTNTQILKYTNTQILKYTNTQIHKYTNTQILKYKKTITSVLDLLAASWRGVNCQRSIAFTFAPWVISNSVT